VSEKDLIESEVRGRKLGASFTNKELSAHFQANSRLPFVEIMAEVMECAPTMDNLHTLADKHPDK